ncbi:hypothetical protein X971_2186 [Agrobacterium tumefaciens LBA4213 (Ach5)]|nr:hypothetical protein X971_2186 [Agrobacterium tumefaciens LBA4213 (Ach5)]
MKPVRLKEFVEEPFAERAGQGQARGPIWAGKAPRMARNFARVRGRGCRCCGCGAICAGRATDLSSSTGIFPMGYN